LFETEDVAIDELTNNQMPVAMVKLIKAVADGKRTGKKSK